MIYENDDLLAAVLALGVDRASADQSPAAMVQRFAQIRAELARMRDAKAKNQVNEWDHTHHLDEP